MAAAEVAVNRAATQQVEAEKAALEAAMTTHLAQVAKATTLVAGATIEHADAEAAKAAAEAIGGVRIVQHNNVD